MNLLPLDEFIAEEKQYRGAFISAYMRELAEKHRISHGRSGWLSCPESVHVPDVLNKDSIKRRFNKKLPDCSDYYDHFFTFKTKEHHHIWAVMPYTSESKETIRKNLEANGVLVMDITEHTPYGDVCIMFDPKTITPAYK